MEIRCLVLSNCRRRFYFTFFFWKKNPQTNMKQISCKIFNKILKVWIAVNEWSIHFIVPVSKKVHQLIEAVGFAIQYTRPHVSIVLKTKCLPICYFKSDNDVVPTVATLFSWYMYFFSSECGRSGNFGKSHRRTDWRYCAFRRTQIQISNIHELMNYWIQILF